MNVLLLLSMLVQSPVVLLELNREQEETPVV